MADVFGLSDVAAPDTGRGGATKLKTAVTGKVKPGSRSAKRRKSYCSRSAGQMRMHGINCSKTPDKRICAARRRWKC